MKHVWQKTCVFLTRRCNLSCRGCNVPNHRLAGEELTTKQWLEAFQILKDLGIGFIVLFGGEPTMRDDLPELIVGLNKIKMPHTIITNGLKMLDNEAYYQAILNTKPYGISVSINDLNLGKKGIYGDEIKTVVGHKLLAKLMKDAPNIDLVANIAVTRQNLSRLPSLVQHFTHYGIWSILTFFHVGKVGENWLYRGTISNDNYSLIIRPEDRDAVKEVADFFIENYEELRLHNSKDYFKIWTTLGISQDWKCSVWACSNINPDGYLLACVDKPMVKPITIFELPNRLEEAYQIFQDSIRNCTGCLWDHIWETNMYALSERVEYGKRTFAHKNQDSTPNQ